LNGALRTARGTAQPIDLIVEKTDHFRTELDYCDGLKYPVLERSGKEADLLDQILKPMTE
jgi:hypothetical protein